MEPGERIKRSFGRRLRAFREASGLTADELAAMLRVHRNTVYHLERGEQWVGAELLERIEITMRIDVARLFSDVAPLPTPQEALVVLTRALAFPDAPLVTKISKLSEEDQEAVRVYIETLEASPSDSDEADKDAPEQGK